MFRFDSKELDDDTDKYKKIYILKNDMNKFKDSFPIDSLFVF